MVTRSLNLETAFSKFEIVANNLGLPAPMFLGAAGSTAKGYAKDTSDYDYIYVYRPSYEIMAQAEFKYQDYFERKIVKADKTLLTTIDGLPAEARHSTFQHFFSQVMNTNHMFITSLKGAYFSGECEMFFRWLDAFISRFYDRNSLLRSEYNSARNCARALQLSDDEVAKTCNDRRKMVRTNSRIIHSLHSFMTSYSILKAPRSGCSGYPLLDFDELLASMDDGFKKYLPKSAVSEALAMHREDVPHEQLRSFAREYLADGILAAGDQMDNFLQILTPSESETLELERSELYNEALKVVLFK